MKKKMLSQTKKSKSRQGSVKLAKSHDKYQKSVEDQTQEPLELSWVLWFESDQPAYLLMVIS